MRIKKRKIKKYIWNPSLFISEPKYFSSIHYHRCCHYLQSSIVFYLFNSLWMECRDDCESVDNTGHVHAERHRDSRTLTFVILWCQKIHLFEVTIRLLHCFHSAISLYRMHLSGFFVRIHRPFFLLEYHYRNKYSLIRLYSWEVRVKWRYGSKNSLCWKLAQRRLIQKFGWFYHLSSRPLFFQYELPFFKWSWVAWYSPSFVLFCIATKFRWSVR